MRTLADMRDANLTLLEMLDAATGERLDPITLESLCAEAAKEIRNLEEFKSRTIGWPNIAGESSLRATPNR